ncbi:ABC transporter substrate-binding protein [Blautia sp. 2744]|uniref:ABC-type Fe3+-hydroxamate transport system, periplasmic component n=3 Tax=Blautia TaxID=572511 RepID=D4LS66_9FIRM|nr:MULTISPECIES: ABC transporter substrate-binding protein [Blautia]MBC5741666.1 ABC transporter substrate-binding protein [Blautia intestinalis]RHA45789.1 Fe3+-hydroxamate ABC transporter substrate-binding protein [Blautia obeum]RHD30357.1 Fe3+-hydroxamate ABC transporter substrate-binding protein [Blautia obeum]RHE36518.1 Fe3+-hydroxamate ABC transporter substrate-binding protein [Blautia obeum]CBL23624.1 ABC-type Fe3+-hydroxamate transport system, periplasmic component [Blautia obeum A2-162
MKKHRQLLALFICLVMSVSLLTGYSETKAATEEPTQSAEQDATQETAETREITDMAGRKVTVPTAENIESVFSAGPVAAIFLYMVAPDKLLGWNYELNDVEKSIILDKYQDLPNFGMGDAVNYEAVIAANPTIAINSGKINDAMVSDCDALSESLGIPVVAVDNELNNSAEAFRFMGELLGVEDHAEELAQYAEQVFTDINALSDIPEEKKVSVYFGNGEDSLETAPRGSQHAQILDVINAVNVADLELGDGSRVQISAEQLLAWDPDVIVVNGEPKADKSGSSAAEDILSNPDYASLKAVQDQKVYGTPNAPFSWVDRPAGPNRLIGMRWFSALIYPEYIKCDINEEIHKFFDLFYHVDLSDEQLQNVLKGTL